MVEGRGRFRAGEELELVGPGMRQARFRVEAPCGLGGELRDPVQPNVRAVLALPAGAQPGDLLRREITG